MLVLIDNITTLPVLFGSVYSTRKLSFLRFQTQKKELLSLKYFYTFWWKRTGETFDHAFYRARYDITLFIPVLEPFFHYLLSRQHRAAPETPADLTPQTVVPVRQSHVEHIRSVAKFMEYINQRYMSPRYQTLSGTESGRKREHNLRMLKSTTRAFSRYKSTLPKKQPYRSLTEEQMCRLDEILLPSSPAFQDGTSGRAYPAVENPLNPFSSPFLQYRNYIIHRMLFNYGLRAGEVMLMTTDSAGVSLPDSRGAVRYLLSVQNLPDGMDDPRRDPVTLKTEHASRIIELDENDWHYLAIFSSVHRAPSLTIRTRPLTMVFSLPLTGETASH
jgi:hypothetical protein